MYREISVIALLCLLSAGGIAAGGDVTGLPLPPAPAGRPEKPRTNEAPLHRISSRTITLPIHVDDYSRSLIRQVKLFISKDRGKSWQPIATASPKEDHLKVTVPQDGEYWFILQTIDTAGREFPNIVPDSKPNVRILVSSSVKKAQSRAGTSRTKRRDKTAKNRRHKKAKRSSPATPRRQFKDLHARMRTLEKNLNNLSINEIRAQLRDLRRNLKRVSRDVK